MISEREGPKRPYTLDDYFNDTIRWRAYNLYWISGTSHLFLTGGFFLFITNYFYMTLKKIIIVISFEPIAINFKK